MLLVKRLPWILLGILIGVGILLAPRVTAHEHTAQSENLIPHPIIGVGSGQGFFIGDPKTHACWLAVLGRDGITALAPAPPEACR